MLSTADVCINLGIANAMNNLSTMNKIMANMILAEPMVQFNLKVGEYSADEDSLNHKANYPVDMVEK